MNYLRLFVFTWMFAVSATALATDTEVIHKRFQGYWTAMLSGQFAAASKFISEQDIEQARKAFVPIYISAAKNSNSGVREQANIFFEGIPVQLRASTSGRDAFIGMNRVAFAASPEIQKSLKGSKFQVTDIKFTSQDEVTVYYTAKMANGYEDDDVERLSRVGGVWFLRLKDIPGTARKLQKAYGR
jgi:hypothetical protein